MRWHDNILLGLTRRNLLKLIILLIQKLTGQIE